MLRARILIIALIFHVEVLKEGLKNNFCHVDVDVVTCPDLRTEPFDLAAEGKNFLKKTYIFTQ